MSQSSAKKKSVPALGTSSTNKKQMTLMSFFSSPANGGGDSAKKAPTVKSSPLGAPETTPLARRASVPQKTPLAKEPFTSPFPVTSAKASGCSPSVRSVGAGVKRQRAIQDSDSENEEPLVGTVAKSGNKSRKMRIDEEDEDDFVDSQEQVVGNNSQVSSLFSDPSQGSQNSSARMDLSAFRADSLQPCTPVNNSRPKQVSSALKSSSITASDKKKERQEKFKDKNERRYDWLLDIKDEQGKRAGDADYDPRTLYIPKAAWKEFTPFEKQFWEIKSKHWDKVVFFKKGKFYELYENDATIGHQEFDLKLTDRVNMRMVGVPEGSFDYWAAQFIAKGHKVAKVDQLENSVGKAIKDRQSTKKKDDIIRRELKSVLTSGTLVDSGLLTNDMSTYCLAIKEECDSNSSPPKFGIAFVDTATAEFDLCSFNDDMDRTIFETLIVQLKPREIIVQKQNLSSATLKIIKNAVVNVQYTHLIPEKEFWLGQSTMDELRHAKYFPAGGEDVSDSRANWPLAIKKLQEDSLAMSALGGLVFYLRSLKLDKELVSARNFAVYDPVRRSNSLVLDGQTLSNLEIFENTFDGSDQGTLFKLINHCETPFGKRQFKRWLCHPLKSASMIKDRQDAVEDLNGIRGVVDRLQLMFRKLPDLERVISRIHAGSCKVKEFVRVLQSLKKLLEIPATLESYMPEFESRALLSILKTGFNQGLLEKIAFFENAFDPAEAMEDDLIKPFPGKDASYDAMNAKVEEIDQRFEKHRKECETVLQHRGLTYRDIGKEIYQLEVPAKLKVPKDWIMMSKTQQIGRYYNEAIRALVKEMQEAKELRDEALRCVKQRMFEKFDEDYQDWLKVIKNVADLDCLISLAKVSEYFGETSCRPEIVQDSPVAFFEAEELKHPCIMDSTSSGNFIPNDTSLGGKVANMILLTGPNMGGKSTLLRQTCIAVILAQLGSYVPAKSLRMTPCDRIFTRIGASDNIMAGQSTFMVELSETSKILKEATPFSLVILDELGRGTSTYDGYAIAYGVLHHLLIQTRCLGLFSTHYGSLAKEMETNPLISLMHMGFYQDQEARCITFLYKLLEGRCHKSYGMNVARLAGVPLNIVEKAEAVASQFAAAESRKQALKTNARSHSDGLDISTTLAQRAGLAQIVKLMEGLSSEPRFTADHAQMVKLLVKSCGRSAH